MRTALYIGGPLDGQHAEKSTPGRWPIYRDDDGNPILTRKGDREWHCLGTEPTRYYTHQLTTKDSRLVDVYVHATAWLTWRTERPS